MQSDRKAGLARGTKCVRTRKHAAQLTKEPSPNASVRFARCRSARLARLQVLDVMSMITIRSATRSEVRPPPRPRKASKRMRTEGGGRRGRAKFPRSASDFFSLFQSEIEGGAFVH